MLLQSNPATQKLHELWREKINKEFDLVDEVEDCLSLIQYIESKPNKFYSKHAFDIYFNFLVRLSNDQIQSLFSSTTNRIDLALKNLKEINELNFHEDIIPADDISRIDFIDKNIHYNYLRLVESCLYPLIYLPAFQSLRQRGKSVEKLDLYNCIEVLRSSDFKFLEEFYNNIVRNGIAHGHIQLSDWSVVYKDKKGNEKELDTYKIIHWFDRMLDCVNGFACAFKVFIFSQLKTSKKSIPLPKQLLIEELFYQSNGPAWKLITVFEGSNIQSTKQLNIYIKNDFFDFFKVQLNALRTAILTEKFTSEYTRVFLFLKSKNGISNGFVAFNGDQLKRLGSKKNTHLEEYAGVIEGDLLFFQSKYKLPPIVYKLGTYRMAISSLMAHSFIGNKKRRIMFRDCKTHAKTGYIVAERVGAYLEGEQVINDDDFIRSQALKIIKKAKSFTKRNYSLLNFERIFPVQYIKVFIYATDQRLRDYRGSGLSSNLICIIHQNGQKK